MFIKHPTCFLGLLLIVGCECYSAPAVTFGRIYSAAVNYFGPECRFLTTSILPNAFADEISCSNEDKTSDLTVWGSLNGPNISLFSFKQSFLLNTSTTASIDVYFDDTGSPSNCTAALEDTVCSSCQVCETSNATVGLSIECPSVPELDSSGSCLENQIIEEASQRSGSFVTNMTFEETMSRLKGFFGTHYSSKPRTALKHPEYPLFYSSITQKCSNPVSDNITSGATEGSAQNETGYPTIWGTRSFQVCSDDDNACSMLFYDDDGSVISACSIIPNMTSGDACASCEVCTSEKGGVGVNVECPTHPKFTTDGCRNVPVLNPTSSPETRPDPSPDTSGIVGKTVPTSLFLSLIVFLCTYGLG